MKNYLVGLLISIFLLVGCESVDFENGADQNQSTGGSGTTGDTETDDNSSANGSDDNATTEDDNVTTEPVTLDKRDVINLKAKEWYVRIVVEDTTNNMKTDGAQIGQLDTADVVLKHSLKAIAPFRPTFLDVVFKNPVGVDAGEYKSNFHESTTAEDTWEFTIKSHDSHADIVLGWRGLYVLTPYVDNEGRERYKEYRSITNPLLSYMTLIDVVTNTEIDVLSHGVVNEYVFNMDGVTERTFRWKLKDNSFVAKPRIRVLQKVNVPLLTQKEKLQKLQVKVLRKDAKATPTKLKIQRVKSLDMMTPPTFEVLVK